MAQTIRKQSELLSNLENNNDKNITAEDIRDVVVSNNGPIMIWAGKLRPYEQGGVHTPQTTFMNPFYFNTGEGTQGTSSTVWQITNSTVTGASDGTYTATSTGQGNFKAKVTVVTNTVVAFEILDPGYGQRNRTAYDVEFSSNGTKTFQMTYHGAIYAIDNADNNFYFRGKGSDNSYHTNDNTMLQATSENKKGELQAYVFDHGGNVHGPRIIADDAGVNVNVVIWKVIKA